MIIWVNNFVARFASDNDCRANTFLLLGAVFGLFWLLTFGITPAAPGLSSDGIEFLKAAGEEIPWLPNLGILEWIKWTGWKFWWLFFILAVIYRLIAWRDEVRRAWERTRQHMAGVREAVKDLTPGVLSDGTVRLEHPIGIGAWIRVFFRELTAASIGDTVVGAIMRR